MDNFGFQNGKDDIQQWTTTNRNGEKSEIPYQKKSFCTRYKNALKTFLPCRSTEVPANTLPLNDIGCYSYLTVSFITSTMWKAFKVGLTPTDLFELSGPEDARTNANRFDRLWKLEQQKCREQNSKLKPDVKNKFKPSASRVAWQFIRTRCLMSCFLVCLSMVFQFVGPSVVLNMILSYLNDPDAPLSDGILLISLLFLFQLLRNITFNMQQSIGIHTAIRLISAVEYLGYSKLLKLTAPNDAALGQLITFCTGDHERIYEAVSVGTIGAGTPLLFLLAISYAIYLVGPSALVGTGVVLMFYPITGGISALTSILRLRVVTITDKRVTMMSEIINSMRLIKMYAWEKPFADRINILREKEVSQLKKSNFLQSVLLTINPTIILQATFFTFLVMTLTGQNLSSTEAFTIISVFNALNFSVATLPHALKMMAEAKVGFGRLQELLEMRDYVQPSLTSSDKDNTNLSVLLRRASFSWEVVDTSQTNKKKSALTDITYVPCLYNISLTVGVGDLVGVAGSVGSGKTSLVSAIMGEMSKDGGDMRVSGSLALVSQQAWIFNSTVRDNIIMGSEFDSGWYSQVVEACALSQDLKMLSNGDMTEIGERGVTLSGGQRQRVNLARALYSDSDIYLLDDPLSAVDAKVGQHIFTHYVQEMLKAKTVILVSHGVQYLEKCDKVVFVEGGRIVEEGTPADLLNVEGGLFANMTKLDTKNNGKKKEEVKKKRDKKVSTTINDEEEAIQKVTTEKIQDRGWSAVFTYLNQCANPCLTIFVFFCLIIFVLCRLSSIIWLQVWMDAGDGSEISQNVTTIQQPGNVTDNPKLWLYQLIYGLILLGMVVFGIIKGSGLLFILMRGSVKIHKSMLNCIMRSPMAFFDTTPSGQILNRFSKDLDEVDCRLPYFVEGLTQFSLFMISQIGLVCFLYPYFTIGFGVIMIVFVMLDITMNKGVLEAKKLENVTKSAVIHRLTSSMTGVNIIRGFNKEDVFKQRFNSALNKSMSADSLFRLATRWYMWRIETLALITITMVGIVVVVTKGLVSTAIAGLALSSAMIVGTFVPHVLKLKSQFRARINSLQRVNEYTELTSEAAQVITDRPPLSNWPKSGHIKLESVTFRYRPELPLVIRDITVDIQGGKTVGIVGRTGAGKSSLISTLLRLSELDSGKIIIDGVDISSLGLSELRSNIAVIPQDPILFQGTIRYNLDPFDQYPDEQVWKALESANLKEKVVSEKNKLETEVEADGGNFSVGEKQLICLARALLRRNKILLLDEATASVDLKTDLLIQATIQTAFKSSTVLTIAHRLNTIMGYDLVLVLDQGKLVEADSPNRLLGRSNGIFSNMAKAAGLGPQ